MKTKHLIRPEVATIIRMLRSENRLRILLQTSTIYPVEAKASDMMRLIPTNDRNFKRDLRMLADAKLLRIDKGGEYVSCYNENTANFIEELLRDLADLADIIAKSGKRRPAKKPAPLRAVG